MHHNTYDTHGGDRWGRPPTVTVQEALSSRSEPGRRLRASTYCEGALETREDELINDMYSVSRGLAESGE